VQPIRIGISACLAGERVRWDGTDRLRQRIVDVIGAMAELVHVCPEVELGLGVPREKIHLVDAGGQVRLVTDRGRDLTDAMASWAGARLARADVADVAGWILKARSPSCDVGSGRFAAAVRARWPQLPVVDEESLADDKALIHFSAAVRAYHANLAEMHRAR
jgi:uncharacterized protein YbbK (DUF523 family)